MEHKTKVVKYWVVEDGSLAVTFQCCDNPPTTSVIYLKPSIDILEWVEEQKTRARSNHEQMLATQEALKKLMVDP